MTDSDEVPLKYLKKLRGFNRTEVTKTITSVDQNVGTWDDEHKKHIKSKLIKLSETLLAQDQEIARLLCEIDVDRYSQEEYDACSTYQSNIENAITKLAIEGEEDESSSSSTSTLHEVVRKSNLKLPEVPLPEYTHRNGEDLHKFFFNFEQIIAKYALSTYEKFVFLEKQLKNEPLILIRSLDINSQKYDTAKQLLLQAFASRTVQQYSTLKNLSSLTLNSRENPYSFIAKMRVIADSFKTLSITTDSVLQYFFWTAMPELLQNELISITNNSKPNLHEIQNNIFIAAERYMSKQKIKPKNEESWEVSGMATAVNYNKNDKAKSPKYCSLCSSSTEKVTTHLTAHCTKYKTASEKKARIAEFKGCFKCANVKHHHHTSDCKYNFAKRCSNCNGPHFSFLCTYKNQAKKSNDNNNGKTKKEQDVNVNSIQVEQTSIIYSSFDGEDSLIPTFSVKVNDILLRGMKDSGCQRTFITSAVAKNLDLKVVQTGTTVNIQGFNSSQAYNTTVVEIPFGKENTVIHAICVPEIKTRVKIKGLTKLVQNLEEKGYKLADDFLYDKSDVITNIDIILGNSDCHVLLQRDVRFGESPYSVISHTPLGIMLAGSAITMLKNINYLPDSENKKAMMLFSATVIAGTTENQVLSFHATNDKDDVMISPDDIKECDLNAAANEIMKDKYKHVMNYDTITEEENEVNNKLIDYVIENTTRTEDGRLVMPLLWNPRSCDLLGKNYNLARSILYSNKKKLDKNPELLNMYDEVINEQVNNGTIEPIANLNQFMRENPTASFLSHMGVFRMQRETTKCRVVYLSNLAEKSSNAISVSHNQATLSGPNLNQKITTSVLNLRFDKYLLCFDLKKAFLNIGLNKTDQNKLLTLWFQDVKNNNFNVVAYRCTRLPFGIKCAPFLLMCALFKLLILDAEDDDADLKELKKHVYHNMYMDNGAVSSNDKEYLQWAYQKLPEIFEPYQFGVQQYVTNEETLKTKIENDEETDKKENEKLFGLQWNLERDTMSTDTLHLNETASTKRQIMSTLAENYDPFLIQGPILNRAKLFAHELQCDNEKGWDDIISDHRRNEWVNIAKQVNKSSPIEIPRSIGQRNHHYELIAFTDASTNIYGVVTYLKNVENNTVSFLSAQSRMINHQLKSKSVPALELNAVSLGTEVLVGLFEELASSKAVNPININTVTLYTDSRVALNWIQSYVLKFDKQNKKSPFVINRLEAIYKRCSTVPITYKFVAGIENPADCITRALSATQLLKSNYFTGPNFLQTSEVVCDELSITVPSIVTDNMDCTSLSVNVKEISPLIETEKYSCFQKVVRLHMLLLKYVRNLKLAVLQRKSGKIETCEEFSHWSMYAKAVTLTLKIDQVKYFPEVLNYLHKKRTPNDMPPLVSQLNLFLDKNGLIRIHSKFDRWKTQSKYQFPILLAKNSPLTSLIISGIHQKMSHAGCYSVLTEFRREFHVSQAFSLTRKILKNCITCRRQNQRPVKINQSSYQEMRVEPSRVPFRSIFLDHCGPFLVENNSEQTKVWILVITCLYSRAVNLKISLNLSTSEFLRNFQMHIFEHGTPENVFSDMGTQLVAGSKLISDHLKDTETGQYLLENNIRTVKFEQYPKGCHKLGSLVESCVKLTKKLLYGSIGKTILPLPHFELLVAQTVSLVNKRPIAFAEYLRQTDDQHSDEIPSPITPEMLIKGKELATVNIIPKKNFADPDYDIVENPISVIKQNFQEMNSVRDKLFSAYESEFLQKLTQQAIDEKLRYKPQPHHNLKVNDIVLLKESNLKAISFPMAKVISIKKNYLDEVTSVQVKKGKTNEIVTRHVNSIIPLLSPENLPVNNESETKQSTSQSVSKPRRQAAIQCGKKIQSMIEDI